MWGRGGLFVCPAVLISEVSAYRVGAPTPIGEMIKNQNTGRTLSPNKTQDPQCEVSSQVMQVNSESTAGQMEI